MERIQWECDWHFCREHAVGTVTARMEPTPSDPDGLRTLVWFRCEAHTPAPAPHLYVREWMGVPLGMVSA